MRKYRIYYYKEISDECYDCEIDIECPNFWDVKEYFQRKIRVYKRIYKVEEIPNL